MVANAAALVIGSILGPFEQVSVFVPIWQFTRDLTFVNQFFCPVVWPP